MQTVTSTIVNRECYAYENELTNDFEFNLLKSRPNNGSA